MKVAITGAQSYTGRYVAQRLLQKGSSILNFTNHPNRHWKVDSENIQNVPLKFERSHLV
jgi:nucleoside-diphosphate-sugar epimerase